MERDENKIETIGDELREKVGDDSDGKRIITPPAALDVFQHPVTVVGPPIPSVAKEVTYPPDIFISPNFLYRLRMTIPMAFLYVSTHNSR